MSTESHYVSKLDTLDWQVAQEFETNFRWEYDDGRESLLNLYRKGKRQQWDAAERIDWSQDLDPENPQTGDAIKIKAKTAVRFKAGKQLDKKVNK